MENRVAYKKTECGPPHLAFLTETTSPGKKKNKTQKSLHKPPGVGPEKKRRKRKKRPPLLFEFPICLLFRQKLGPSPGRGRELSRAPGAT